MKNLKWSILSALTLSILLFSSENLHNTLKIYTEEYIEDLPYEHE